MIDTLAARRQAMNQGGSFDRVGNRSRYDQSQQRQDEVLKQLNDQGMRERMQGRDLSTRMAMQGNEINSRYGLAAQEAKARERQAAQEFGHSMARLNAEFGFKSGEANKDRSHVKSMADFEAQLREVAASKDFQRGLERLAVEYGMSKEEATTAFNRMLEGKQVDFQNQTTRDQALHGFGQQDLRLQSQLGEQEAQSQFGRDAQMEGVRSRYDLLGQEQRFGHDRQLNEQKFGYDKTLSDMETERQFGYQDRQNDYAMGLNEQKFTQQQQQAMQEINRRKDEQFDMALNEARGRADNLNPHGQRLLKEIEDGVSEIEAIAPKNGEEWARQAKQQLLGKIGQAMQPQLLQSKIQTIDPEGKVKGWYDQKKEWRELPPPNANSIEALPPDILMNGGVWRGPDGSPRGFIQPQKGTAPGSASYQDDIKAIAEIAAKSQKPALDEETGRQMLGVDGKPLYVPLTWEEAEEKFELQRRRGQGQGDAWGGGDMNSNWAGGQPNQPPQQQGMMQRGPQAQPPRPQNTMQGQQQAPQIAPIEQQRLQAAGFDGRQLVMARQILESNKDILSQVSSVEELPEQLRLQISHALQIHNIATGRRQ